MQRQCWRHKCLRTPFCKVMNENARDEESARRPLLGQANGNGSSGDYDAVGMPTQTVGRNREDSQRDARRIKFMIIKITFIMLVLYFAGVAWSYTAGQTKHGKHDIVYNNGTHDYYPTVVMISLDGVVNHDLDLSMTPNLKDLADQGVRARWMTPSFPPITFPNHWSLVTGLYPESHGIISNYFYDPILNDTFNYKDPAHSWDSKWWGGEPIWITAVRQGRGAATIMWPGCSTDFNGLRPTLSIPYADNVKFDSKIDQTLEWLDLPIHVRPQIINVYVPEIDQAGHKHGPYANETLKQLRVADASVGRLLKGLAARNLTDIVHVFVVSDHGMSALDVSRTIYYDDELTAEELSLIETIEADPLLEIRLRSETEENIEKLYRAFQRLENNVGHFKVYKKQDFPARFHYSHNARIPPLIVLPEAGWRLITRRESSDHKGAWFPNGTHGYDNLDPQSRAIFVARGPIFADIRGSLLKPFWNVELYQVLSRILNIRPAANNGTLNGAFQVVDDE